METIFQSIYFKTPVSSEHVLRVPLSRVQKDTYFINKMICQTEQIYVQQERRNILKLLWHLGD